MLVSTSELAGHLADDNWRVFDCRHDLMDPARGREKYESGHIAGAYFAHVDDDLSSRPTGTNGRHPLPSPEDFAAYLGACGVTATTHLVAYDDVGGQYAARFWWLCRWIGIKSVSILDGGWSKWVAESRATHQQWPPKILDGGAVGVNLQPHRLAEVSEIESLLNRPNALMVDARAAERFRGEVEPIDRVAGHIPGARNFVFQQNQYADQTFKPSDVLRRQWTEFLGSQSPDSVVHQCGSGITACVNLFAMELAGLSGSRLYAGSWSEWSSDPSRPVATGD